MNDFVLLADSGSTKTDWCLIDEKGLVVEYNGIGLNPDFHTNKSIDVEISKVQKVIGLRKVSAIYFYGSGVSSEQRKRPIISALEAHFSNARIFVEHDLLGAAKATLGDQAGLVGILGTGSNCCSYTGKEIDLEYRSGGYILSDEGGGVYLGKMILKAFIEDQLDEPLRIQFEKDFDLGVDDILQKIYKEELPNRFIASFSRFAKENEEHPQMKEMIENNFRDFFELKVSRFDDYQMKPLGLVGSMAVHFESQLKTMAVEYRVEISTIVKSPIVQLANYHQLKLARGK